MKHDLVYELLGGVLQLSFGHFVVFQDVKGSLRGASIIKPREDKCGH